MMEKKKSKKKQLGIQKSYCYTKNYIVCIYVCIHTMYIYTYTHTYIYIKEREKWNRVERYIMVKEKNNYEIICAIKNLLFMHHFICYSCQIKILKEL